MPASGVQGSAGHFAERPRSLVAASSDGGPCSVMAAGTRTEPRPQRRTRRSASLHGKNPMEDPGPSWPLLLMEGHALSWPQALPVPKRTQHEPNHGPKDGRDGARPSMGNARNTDATERVPPWEKHDGGPRSLVAASSDGGPCSVMAASPASPKTDATECVPPWEKPDGGPRSLVAASSDGGPCSVMAASTRTEPRPQRRTRRSASLHGKNPMEGHGPLWPLHMQSEYPQLRHTAHPPAISRGP